LGWSPWERMLINANKRVEEEEEGGGDDLRRENGE
jgi:hypothetical protein